MVPWIGLQYMQYRISWFYPLTFGPLYGIYTKQQKKRILFNIHLIRDTVIKIYPELYEYV